MENPINTVKNSLTVSGILKGAVVFIVVAIAFDVLGLTPWLLTPWTTAKVKYEELTKKKA